MGLNAVQYGEMPLDRLATTLAAPDAATRVRTRLGLPAGLAVLLGIVMGIPGPAVQAQIADLEVLLADGPDPVVAGDRLDYTATVRNLGPDAATGVVLTTVLPPELSVLATNGCLEDPVGVPTCTLGAIDAPEPTVLRATEYPITNFGAASYQLTLDDDLAPDYFVIIRGAGEDGGADTTPAQDFARLAGDPFGTGDLEPVDAPDRLKLNRGTGEATWSGMVTVVECLSGCDAGGFRLLTVEEVLHPGDDSAVFGSDVASVAWSDPEQILLMAGFRGAGCVTEDTDPANHPICHARFAPSGSNGIEWTRDTTGADLTTPATSTVMVLEWGSEWTVQRVRVGPDDPNGGDNGGDGVDQVSEYTVKSLPSSVDRDNTWVWGTGHTKSGGSGSSAEGVVVTLGNGVDQNATESSVAVGIEHPGNAVDFEVWALSHPGLRVDHVFKPDGDAGNTAVEVAADSAPQGHRLATVTNGLGGTGTEFPAPMFSARYKSDTEIVLQRNRSGLPFPAWVQGVDLSSVASPGVPVSRQVQLEVEVSPSATGDVAATASVAGDQGDPCGSNNSASATTDVVSVADLSIQLSDDPDPIIAGRQLSYTATVFNSGPSDASLVAVHGALPPSLTLVKTVGCLEDPVGAPLCSLGSIPAGGTAQFLLEGMVSAEARGGLTWTASVTSSTSDPHPADNVASESTALTGEIDVGRGAAPAIASEIGGDGEFVIAWQEGDAPARGREGDAIRARRFTADGMPVGIEFVVSGDDGEFRGAADTTYTDGGGFVVTWHGEGIDGDGLGIAARRFDSMGMPVGIEFRVNDASDRDQSNPAIAADRDGFVVVWVDQTGPSVYEHALRRFDADGMPVGVELRFGATDIQPTAPAVAVSPTGALLVAWEGTTDRISGLVVDPDGMPVGVEFQIDSGIGTASAAPAVAWKAPGQYVVAWDTDADGDGRGVFARFLDPLGMPVGIEFQVNTTTAGEQVQAAVATDSTGEVVIAWQSDDADGRGIAARRFSASGMPVGVELRLNRSQEGEQSLPSATYTHDGTFYVTWESEDTSGDGLTEILAAQPDVVFADGFESGSSHEWSASVGD
jgi:uncharacterized repeat protein (TIGR01451 family)